MARFRPLCAAACVALALSSGFAEAAERELTVGFGVGAANDHEGADEFQALPLLSFDYQGRQIAVRSQGLGVEADMIPSARFQAGPTANYRGGRDDDVDDAAVALLPEVDDSIELGAYFATGAPLTALGLDDPGLLTVRFDFAHDVAEGHNGFLVRGALAFIRPLDDDLKAVIGLSTTYASSAYMNAFFDVTPAGAAASGLAPFNAEAGFKDVGATAVLSYKFADRWTASLIGNYRRLVGDAADSPVVQDVGSPNQFFGGVSIGYRVF